jgi:hypothetical protein
MNKLIPVLIMQVALLAACSKKPPEDFASHMNVPFDHRVPEYFETYLAEHPDDGDHRAAALVYYDRRERNPERLKYHTFEMIERRPWNLNIYFENVWLLYSDPAYRSNVIVRLERKASEPNVKHGTFWNLALTCKTGVMPPHDGTPEGRAKFLKSYGLKDDAPIPTSTDPILVQKTEEYFRKAISLAKDDTFHVGLYSKQLAHFLVKLGRDSDAIAVCESALAHSKRHRPDKHLRSLVEDQTNELKNLKNLIKKIKEGPAKPRKIFGTDSFRPA